MRANAFPPPTRREIFSWCGFDFANSSFTTVMVTAMFSVYFCEMLGGAPGDGERWWGVVLSMGQWIVVGISPFLGAWADWHAAKKRVLYVTYLVCVAATFCLGYVYPGHRMEAVVLMIVALVAFSVGENFCASFLPELASKEKMGRVSGYGWAFGYLGGMASLGLCYGVMKGLYGDDVEEGYRASARVTALFFLISGLPTFLFLKERALPRKGDGFHRRRVWHEWWQGFCQMLRSRRLMLFLTAFFCYSAGMATVIGFSSIFAAREFGMQMGELLIFFFIVQISSAFGALGCGFLQDRWGSFRCLLAAVLLWILVVAVVVGTHSKMVFYLMANFAGVAIGSTQSMSRAVIGRLVPQGRQGEYFGYWGTVGKLAAGFGPFVYGIISAGAGSLRVALATMIIFFVGGVIFLILMKSGVKRNPIDF